jgi:cation transporter-like permease
MTTLARRCPVASMRTVMKRLFVVVVIVLGLAVIFGFFGWAFYVTRGSDWTGGSTAITVAMIAGTIAVGALTGVLMWLAFYSSRRGYDDPPRFEEPKDGD